VGVALDYGQWQRCDRSHQFAEITDTRASIQQHRAFGTGNDVRFHLLIVPGFFDHRDAGFYLNDPVPLVRCHRALHPVRGQFRLATPRSVAIPVDYTARLPETGSNGQAKSGLGCADVLSFS
jgi:hypothetical protein